MFEKIFHLEFFYLVRFLGAGGDENLELIFSGLKLTECEILD